MIITLYINSEIPHLVNFLNSCSSLIIKLHKHSYNTLTYLYYIILFIGRIYNAQDLYEAITLNKHWNNCQCLISQNSIKWSIFLKVKLIAVRSATTSRLVHLVLSFLGRMNYCFALHHLHHCFHTQHPEI